MRFFAVEFVLSAKVAGPDVSVPQLLLPPYPSSSADGITRPGGSGIGGSGDIQVVSTACEGNRV